MKVMTVLGTRPEIIRLSLIITKLDRYCDHTLVHTGQNFDKSLNDIFFQDLGIRKPDNSLLVHGETFAEQIGKIFIESDRVIRKVEPDALLILGDTNSGLVSFVARRYGIPTFHMEAGNRCYDDRVPEEVNRRVIDHCSTLLLPYTERSKENLIREGISRERIYVIGNPIFEVLQQYSESIRQSPVLEKLRLKKQNYFLVTMHRTENVDVEERLQKLVEALEKLQGEYDCPVICSLHPRTRSKMQQYKLEIHNPEIHLLTPLGFFDFVKLEQAAFCVLTDSGTVQEECCIFHVPNLTIRDTTERPETIECGSNMLTGVDPERILDAVHITLQEKQEWTAPPEYTTHNVSSKVVKIVLGYHREHQ